MSLGDFKLGEPINQGVADKIKALQTVFGDTTDSKDRQSYINLQQAVPWIRMQSGVTITDDEKAKLYGVRKGNFLAKQNILFGLNARIDSQDDKGNFNVLQSYSPNDGVIPGYEVTGDFGIRPRPGITNMTIHSHNRFGSLRTAVVNFQCWSKEQIDAMEVLYMRPGYTVLLEWGHSKNLKFKSGGTPDGVQDMDLGIDFYDSKYTSAIELRNAILQKRKDNHFGYDAIVGTIKNFSWKLRKDGGYDCSTSLVTAGDLIESYKANFFLSQGTINDDLVQELEELKQNNNPTAAVFPNLFRDDYQAQAPQIGGALDNLMKGFAQQANAAIQEIANYIDPAVAGGFDDKYKGKTDDIQAEAVKGYFTLDGTPTGGTIPFEWSRVNSIDKGNFATIRKAIATVIRSVSVVNTQQFEHSFQGLSWRDKYIRVYADYGIQEYFYGAELTKYILQTKWPVLVNFGPGNGFDGSGTPDLTLPDGGRASFEIPYESRAEAIKTFNEAFNRGDGYGYTYDEEEGQGEDRSAIMQLYGTVLNLIPNISADMPDGQKFFADQTNIGDVDGTGLTGDTSDLEIQKLAKNQGLSGTWQEVRRLTHARVRQGRDGTLTYLEDRDSAQASGYQVYEAKISTMAKSIPGVSPILYTGPNSTVTKTSLPQGFSRKDALKEIGYEGLAVPKVLGIGDDPKVELSGITDSYESISGSFTRLDPNDSDNSVTFDGFNLDPFPSDTSNVRFMVMKWTGFDSERALQATTVTGADADTGATYTYHDPNDDYVSKLHYYLRTKIESPYIQEYLSRDFSGATFRNVFRYRQITNPDDIATDVLAVPGNEDIRRTNNKASLLAQMHDLLGGRFQSEKELLLRNYVYIRLGVLLEIINKHVLRSDNEYFFTFQSTYDDGKAPEYLTFDDHISTDPRVCILPHTLLNVLDDTLVPEDKKGTDPKILNIEVSISYILETLNKYIGAQGRVPMLDFMQSLLDGIARVCGDQNSFALQYMEDDSVFHVVDRRSLARTSKSTLEDNAKINVFGLNSIVRDVNLVSKITAKMSSMVAISAQDNPYTAQDEATGFNGINRGLEDQVYKERYEIEKNTTEQSIKSYNELRDKLREDIIGVLVHLGCFYEKCIVPRHAVDTQVNVYANYCKFLFGGDTRFNKKNKRSTYSFIIPFELHLGMYGISGLRVMDSFIINKDLLPNTYGGDPNQPVGFLITGVEHQVDKSNWSTKLKTQIYNIDENPSSVKVTGFSDLKDDFVKAVEHIQVGSSGVDGAPGAGGADLKRGVDVVAINTKANPETASTKHYLIPAAKAKFEEMFKDCEDDIGLHLKVKSSFRSKAEQRALIDWERYYRTGGKPTDTKRNRSAELFTKKGAPAAFPGESNHQKGLALDLYGSNPNGGTTDKEIAQGREWVRLNGIKYGWSWWDGRNAEEPWHFVYETDPSSSKLIIYDFTGIESSKYIKKHLDALA